MNAHIAKSSGKKRPRTRRQLISNAHQQAKRLADGDHDVGWTIGIEIGESLASAVMFRNLTGDEKFGFWLGDLLGDVLDLPGAGRTEEENLRIALFIGICKEYDKVVRWAYERNAFKFNFGDEREVMSEAVRRAEVMADNIKKERASLPA